MATLTATFDLKDNISRKLKTVSKELDKVQTVTELTNKEINKLDQAKARPTLSVIDGASGTIKTVRGDLGTLGEVKAKPTVVLDDKASSKLEDIQKKSKALNGSKAKTTVTVDDQATSKIEAIEARLQGLQNTALTITAGGAFAGHASMSVGSSALETNARTAATTGMSSSGVNSIVNDIFYGSKAGNSREEVAMSVQNFAQQTDLSGGALQNAALNSNQIAQLYQKDVPEVDRALGSMIKNFDIDSTRAGDNIAYVFKHAGDQYDDLLDTFQEYSSTFADLQMAPEQVSAAFVAGTKGGARNFDNMADSMREFNLRRSEMSDEQVAAFKKVLGAEEAKKMFKGFEDGSYTGQEAMFRLSKGLSEITNETDRAAIATTLIGTQYEDLKQPILDMAGAIGEPVKATGELNKQFETLRDNNPMTPINDAGRNLKETVSEVGVGILTTLVPAAEKLNTWLNSSEGKVAIEEMTTSISDFVSFFSDKMVPAIQFGVEHFELLAPAIGIGTVAIGALGIGALVVIPTLKKFGEALDFVRGLKGGKRGKGATKGLDDVTTSMSRMDKKSKAGAKSVGTFSQKLKDLFKIKAPKDNPLFGADGTKAGGAAKKGGKFGKVGGGLLKGAGRFLLPVGVGIGAYDILTSSAGTERNQAIGGAIGGVGGGWGGAAAGASVGTLIAPGVGTLIGGLAGGAAGYFGGDKIGSWIGGLFGGDKKKDAAQPSDATAGVEKELKVLSEKGTTYGKAFATNFSKGLNAESISITTWLSSKVYSPMGNAAKSANHFGYAFSYGFVDGLNNAPISVLNWLSEKVYSPMGHAATSANHFGYAFAYGFSSGLSTVDLNLTSWLLDKVYGPMGDAAKASNHYGYAFAYGFMSGLTASPLSMTGWISSNIYQPLNGAAAGSKGYGSALVYNFKEGIKAIPVGMSVWLKNHVETPTRGFVPKGMDWGSGMIGYFITGMNSQGNSVTEAAKNLAKRVDSAFRKELGIASPSKRMMENGYWSAMGVVKGFSSVDVSNIAKSKADEMMAAFGGNYSGGGAGMAKSAIMQALMMLGKPMSLLNPLMTIANKESGFNPRAINDWDINAQRGDPSVGLFQIINSTFQRWKVPGADDRTNPLHSALAAIRYMDGRYGGVLNHPGIKNMSQGGGYLPYAKGGVITHDHIARVGEQGKKEVIIPLEQHRNRALGLLDFAQKALGVSPAAASVSATLPQNYMQSIQSSMNRGVQAVKSGIGDVIVQITGDNYFHNDMDAEKVGRIAVNAVTKALEREAFEMGSVIVNE